MDLDDFIDLGWTIFWHATGLAIFVGTVAICVIESLR